eukprot:scaffold5395_cov54-Phaeocystis_antarctica.AAC.1
MARACLATASAETVASSVSLSISEISSASRFRSMMPPMKPPLPPLPPGEASPSRLVAELPSLANPLATPPKKPLVGVASSSSVACRRTWMSSDPDTSNPTFTRGAADGAPSGDVGVWAGAGTTAAAAAAVAVAVATAAAAAAVAATKGVEAVAVAGVVGRLMVRWTLPVDALIMAEASRCESTVTPLTASTASPTSSSPEMAPGCSKVVEVKRRLWARYRSAATASLRHPSGEGAPPWPSKVGPKQAGGPLERWVAAWAPST